MSAVPSSTHDLASPIRVLYAASSPADGEFVRSEAGTHSPLISITCANGADEALTCLDAIGPFDAVLIDPQLPDGSAHALISRIRHRNPGVGIVACVTGDDDAMAGPALEAGAHAWIPKRKDALAQLYPVFRRAIDSCRESSEADATPLEADEPAGEPAPTGEGRAPVSEGLDAARAMRDAVLVHEAERARLDEALAEKQAEVARLAVELAALRHAQDAERQDSEARVRAAQEAASAERETMRNVLAEREQARATLAQEIVNRRQQYETALTELQAAIAARDRDLARAVEELDAARVARAAAAEVPDAPAHDRQRLDARAEAGRLIAAVTDDVDLLLSTLDRECAQLRAAVADGQATVETVAGVERTTRDGRALTRMLRAFSRRQIQRARTTDLDAALSEVRPVLARLFDEDVQLAIETATGSGPVAIDPAQLERVLVTVAMALRSQLPSGGQVTIAAKPTAPTASGHDDVVAGDPARGVLIDVTARWWRHDIGIPELASDRWLVPSRPEPLKLAHLEDLLKAEGGWLDASGTTSDRIAIRIGLM